MQKHPSAFQGGLECQVGGAHQKGHTPLQPHPPQYPRLVEGEQAGLEAIHRLNEGSRYSQQ